MNPNGEQQSARARAQAPGPSAASESDDGAAQPARPAPDAYRRPSSGRASVSGAVPGGARGSADAARPAAASARASATARPAAPAVGSASGTARVGGRAPVSPAKAQETYRPATARAAVRPTVAPGSPAASGYDELGGPTRSGYGGLDDTRAALRRRRANILTAAAAVVVILLGAGVVAGTWFFDDVEFTQPKPEEQVTQLLASDGRTQIGTIGDQNRSVVPHQSINPVIGQAVMAAEDQNFMSHKGIDMKGILRAAWNNVTGGSTQGASTITQQLARHLAELKEISIGRKAREAIIARKIEDYYSKEEILGRYLNAVYFGRGAYGIEAAVKAYFGPSRSSLTQPGQKGAITAAEAAVLAAVIKQPEKVEGGHPGFDPQNNLKGAKDRWSYTLNNMVEMGWLSAADRPAKYPKVQPFKPSDCGTTCGNNKPAGKIIKYVKQELLAMGVKREKLETGGLRITTTIDPGVQKAAEAAANRANADSPLRELDGSYKSALVAVDPKTGRVLAYYGGPKGDGGGWDYAGPNYGSDGTFLGGGRPPGSSFKVYTLLAAMSEGFSFKTVWDSTQKKVGGDTINNASRDNLKCDPKSCDLETATVQSYNFPFYWLADGRFVGAAKVITAAHAAGVQYISDPNKAGARLDLNKVGEGDLTGFGNEVGFGQYAVTPLDHANGVATLAADGVYNKAHFVRTVEERDAKTGKFRAIHGEQLKGRRAFDQNVVAAIDHVLQKIPGENGDSLDDGRPAIGKTGTWEFADGTKGGNGDAWMVGATRQIAASVWVGRDKEVNKKTKLLPIETPEGKPMTGGSTPAEIWKQFMDAASDAMNAPIESFPPNVEIGDPNKKGNGVEPVQQPEPEDDCFFGFVCPDDNGDNNGNNGDGNGNNGDGNGNNGDGNGNNGDGNGNNGDGNGNNGDGNGNNGDGNGNNGDGNGNNGDGNGNNGEDGGVTPTLPTAPAQPTDPGGGGGQEDDDDIFE